MKPYRLLKKVRPGAIERRQVFGPRPGRVHEPGQPAHPVAGSTAALAGPRPNAAFVVVAESVAAPEDDPDPHHTEGVWVSGGGEFRIAVVDCYTGTVWWSQVGPRTVDQVSAHHESKLGCCSSPALRRAILTPSGPPQRPYRQAAWHQTAAPRHPLLPATQLRSRQPHPSRTYRFRTGRFGQPTSVQDPPGRGSDQGHR